MDNTKEAINISNTRQLFWDSYCIDEELTTATMRLGHFAEKEVCAVLDQGKELMSVSFLQIVKVPAGYRMYYCPWSEWDKEIVIQLAVLESKDGIKWNKPHLDIFPHPELKENNIVIDKLLDNAFVFYDPNPDCPADRRFKAICSHPPIRKDSGYEACLYCYTSSDGYHFKESHLMSEIGTFDTLNTVCWRDGKYACYIRNFHGYEQGKSIVTGIRDIRVMYSEDFFNWSEPVQIEYDDGLDYAMYTNNVQIYDRAPEMLVGFPVRYCERKKWTSNNEQMPSAQVKKNVMKLEERFGLAATDCIFMNSRDGKIWHRNNEAFFTPGYETEDNWVYGDCYLCYGMIDSGKDSYYMYCHNYTRTYNKAKEIVRYEIRKDGFACYAAGGREEILITKPLVFSGKDLHINFETSAKGYIYVDVLDENSNNISNIHSFEIYGNNIDRVITFEDGSDFARYSGKPVRLRFKMFDAKLYSIKFE